ncbi:MAG: riboflavin synthase [Sphingomicrobium sp.]
MFTGIITDIGAVRSVRQRGDLRVTISCNYEMAGVDLGASIACSGVCLTVVEKGDGWFAVDLSNESVNRTASSHWEQGAKLNLERALRLGDELGGHLVTGHIDGVAKVETIVPAGDSLEIAFRISRDLGKFIAPKGSVTIDGASLTVNVVSDRYDHCVFSVNVIPHTANHTTLGSLSAGDGVNVEIDVLARYLQRLEQARAS